MQSNDTDETQALAVTLYLKRVWLPEAEMEAVKISVRRAMWEVHVFLLPTDKMPPIQRFAWFDPRKPSRMRTRIVLADAYHTVEWLPDPPEPEYLLPRSRRTKGLELLKKLLPA